MSATRRGAERRTIGEWLVGYDVGIDGVIRSAKRGDTLRALAIGRDRDGYQTVQLTIAQRSRSFAVHRLVALVHLPPKPSPRHEVRHLDGDKNNNATGNLAWGTRKENADDRERHGRTARGGRNGGGGKLTVEAVAEIKRRLRDGATQTSLASAFGVSIGMVNHIAVGRQWRYVA